MSSEKRLRESKEREKRRQDWAALQNPELVTTQQALRMLGRTNGAGFSDYMKLNNVIPIRVSGFFSANFYIKSEVEKLMLRGQSTVAKRAGRPVGSVNSSTKKVSFESMQDGVWTKEEFMEAWGNTSDSEQAQMLLERAPSFFRLPPLDAFHLMVILLNLGGRDFRLANAKCDRRFYPKYIKAITKNQQDYNRLLEITNALYTSTDIGVFDPVVTVSVLYELMISKPAK